MQFIHYHTENFANIKGAGKSYRKYYKSSNLQTKDIPLPTTNGEMIFSNDLLAGIFFLLFCFFALFINEFHTYVYVIFRIRPATQAQSKARYAM